MLGILSDSDFEEELLKLQGPRQVNGTVVERKLGRGNVEEIPLPVRALIAETSLEGIPAKEVARAFDVSESSVSAYKAGATSTATINEPNAELTKRINEKRSQINETAHSRIIDALTAITPAKLAEGNLKTVSAVARDLSAVVKNIQPEVEQKKDVQFIVFAPQMKTEDDYLKAIKVE